MRPSNSFDTVALFMSRIPVDVIGLARALGVNVWKSESSTLLPGGASGAIKRDPKHGGQSGYSIIVRAQDSENRQRFTVAHEIAHFLLHRDKIGAGLSDDALYRSEKVSSSEEREANCLAADILMPTDQILEYRRAHPEASPAAIAKAFGVSEQAMIIRLG